MLSRTTRRTALALALAAAAVPAAPPTSAGAGTTTTRAPAAVYSRQDKSMIPGAPSGTTLNTAQPVVRIQAPNGGFDWGDAGIGAAGGLALALLGVGGVIILNQHGPRRTGNTTATPR